MYVKANTNIEKNVPFLREHIRYRSIYIFTGHICDAEKVEIICAIRVNSQLKINVLHVIIITSHVFKIKRHCYCIFRRFFGAAGYIHVEIKSTKVSIFMPISSVQASISP